MLKWLKRKVKQAVCPCQHEGITRNTFRTDIEELAPAGVTLSWGGNPVLLRRWIGTCVECGKREIKTGYSPYYPDNGLRDEKGWPLMPNGEPYPIAHH